MAAFILGALYTSAAKAVPCEGSLPARGTVVSGPVRYVVDGDGLCMGTSPDPQTWVEVRLADFYAPELHAAGGAAAKATLERLVRGEYLVCLAGRKSYDRVVASCTVRGRDLGDRLRAAGVVEGGEGGGPEASTRRQSFARTTHSCNFGRIRFSSSSTSRAED